jgi:hypothetical protein
VSTHRDAVTPIRTPEPRAVQPTSCTLHVPEQIDASAENDVDDPNPRAAQTPRTETSIRAEVAHRDLQALPPSQRPLALARAEFARAFDSVMHNHWLAGEGAYSNVAVARACGVDEKTIRQWREGEKPFPAAALTLLPGQLFDEIMSHVAAARGRTPRRAVVQLREALTALRVQAVHEDQHELTRALLDAQRELLDIMSGGR